MAFRCFFVVHLQGTVLTVPQNKITRRATSLQTREPNRSPQGTVLTVPQKQSIYSRAGARSRRSAFPEGKVAKP